MTDRKPVTKASTQANRPSEAFAVRRDVTGLTRESGYQRGNLTEADAHARKPHIHQDQPALGALAYPTDCRYCGDRIYVAYCSDGRWRSFDLVTFPAAPTCVWAWRRHHGMQEQELVPGKRLHFCPEYDRPDLGAIP